jgi:peroxiredoxin
MRSWWSNRWVRAAGVALLVAAWPACNSNVSPPEPTETPSLDFVLNDMAGNEVALADFEGKPLLINFWATWCGPCKLEVPWFVEFTERYKDQQFTVVGISLDDPVEDIRAFAEEYKVNYTMLVGKGREEVARAYGAEAVLPVTWLIRPDGTVQAKAVGIHGKEWFESQIEAMF